MTKKSAKRLLIVDDDRFLCRTIAEGLADPGIEVTAVHSGREGRNFCAAQPVDLVLLDQKLPDANGIDCCAALLGLNERLKIIFITAYPSFENAVQAIKLGAHDYLSKPFELGELRLAVTNALRTIDLEQVEQVQLYKSRVESHDSSLIGARGALSEVWRLVQLAAHNPAPVLITGETGTGKSMVAKAIHYHGPDAAAPFLGINCAALPENLIEAELFGYEKGAFTGAAAAAKGIFELADQGTLFLDEIGEIPLHLQSKLLGVLDDHQIRRLGGQRFIPVRTRLIAATNADLAAAVRERRFREDLFYRLSVMPIHVPPLRDRLGDIAELCRYFLAQTLPGPSVHLAEEEIEALAAYPWPGNVRELRNVIERAVLLRSDHQIRPSRLLGMPNSIAPNTAVIPSARSEAILTLEAMEKDHILKTLAHFSGNHTQTAKALGISRSTLLRKLQGFVSSPTVLKSAAVAK